jgi:hypothetical protein
MLFLLQFTASLELISEVVDKSGITSELRFVQSMRENYVSMNFEFTRTTSLYADAIAREELFGSAG